MHVVDHARRCYRSLRSLDFEVKDGMPDLKRSIYPEVLHSGRYRGEEWSSRLPFASAGRLSQARTRSIEKQRWRTSITGRSSRRRLVRLRRSPTTRHRGNKSPDQHAR